MACYCQGRMLGIINFRKLEKMRSHQLVLADKFRNLLPDEFRDQEVDVQAAGARVYF